MIPCARVTQSDPIVPRFSTLPARELHAPFTSGLHPAAARFGDGTVRWAVAMGLVADEVARARLERSRVGQLVGRANPTGDAATLQIAADWTALFCSLDDTIERLDSPADVARYLDGVFLALTGLSNARDPIHRAAFDIHCRLRALASSEWLKRFAARNSELFEAFELEAQLRSVGGTVDVRRYLPMREVTVGVAVELELSELALGLEIGPSERAVLRPMSRICQSLVGWANDIFTFEKELAAGDPNNLVLVLARGLGGDLRAALARAIQMHDREANELAIHIAQGELGGDAARYAERLGAWVRGHLDWARETGRYRVSDGEAW